MGNNQYIGGHTLIKTRVEKSKKQKELEKQKPKQILIRELLNSVIDAELKGETYTDLFRRHKKRLLPEIINFDDVHSWAKAQLEYEHMLKKKTLAKQKKQHK